MSELLLICVPDGWAPDGSARLHLLVVPRLTDGTLADNGLTSWPPPALASALKVRFASVDQPVDATVTLGVQDGLWSSVFGNATVTAPPAPAGDKVEVDGTVQHAAGIATTYQSAADPSTTSAQLDRVMQTRWGRPRTPPTPAVASRQQRTTAPMTDVHRIYGVLREHPTLLTALGLRLELTVPAAAVPSAARGTVRVEWPSAPSVSPPLPTVVARETAYVRDEFRPAPATETVEAGVVRLDRAADWMLTGLDVDDAVNRLRAAADSGSTEGLPTLRTAGLALLRANRQEDFDARAQRAAALATTASEALPPLTAEDLLLGYRIDVRVAGTTQWHSLCAREVGYRVDDVPVGATTNLEEGHVKVHAAVRPLLDDGTGADTLYADEVITRWDGWSLAVPRPFPPPAAGRAAADNAMPYRLDVDMTVPAGSLPPLRFGTKYEFRARVADLAGSGVEVDDPAADRNASESFTFRRYEPVLAPTIVLPDATDADHLSAGGNVAHLVIRSDGGDPTATEVDVAPASDVRRILPRPTAPLSLAEWHGEVTGTAAATLPIAELAAAGTLPDPAARSLYARLVAEPGQKLTTSVSRNWPAWPDAAPTSIELTTRRPGSSQVLAAAADGITVRLAPAEDMAVALSSAMASTDTGLFAIGAWSSVDVADQATSGRHPLLTPAATVRCVHAVRKPLKTPSGTATGSRTLGAMVADLTPTVAMFGVDAASTGQVDVTAAWTEVTDDQRLDLTDVPVQSLVVHRGDTTFADDLRHQFGDTRHRTVRYTVTAVSRFGAYFPEASDADLRSAPLSFDVDVLSTARPAAPVVRSVVPAFEWTEQRTGRVITRRRGGNRIRVELDRPWHGSGDDERLALVFSTGGSDTVPVTQVGRDPIWQTTAPTRRPTASVAVGSGDPGDRVSTVEGPDVDVVPAVVWFDSGRWYADFALPDAAPESYGAMMRPALARYQRHSLRGCALSAVVLGDFVPLLPDRELRVERTSSSTVSVQLSGLGPAGPVVNRVDVVVERAVGAGSDLVSVAADGAHGWVAVGPASSCALGERVELPMPAGSGAVRVRVREVEVAASPEGGGGVAMGTSDEVAERTVFVDAVAPTDAS